jgi:hypothetical protein
MEERLKLSHHSEAEEEDVTFYRKPIGSLRYLVHTYVAEYVTVTSAIFPQNHSIKESCCTPNTCICCL